MSLQRRVFNDLQGYAFIPAAHVSTRPRQGLFDIVDLDFEVEGLAVLVGCFGSEGMLKLVSELIPLPAGLLWFDAHRHHLVGSMRCGRVQKRERLTGQYVVQRHCAGTSTWWEESERLRPSLCSVFVLFFVSVATRIMHKA